MSSQRPTILPPILTQTLPRLLLPLAPLLLSTVAAFTIAVRANYTNLSSLWAQCSPVSYPSSSSSSSSSLAGGLQEALRTPPCFAVLFFQTALGSTLLARLEMASIIAFLAALATVTATEAARVRAEEARDRQRAVEPGKEKQVAAAAAAAEDTRCDADGHPWSLMVIRNLTVPWLLYSLALGATAWQAIIVPAFIARQSTARRRHRPLSPGLPPGPGRPRLAVAAGTLFGVLAPSAVFLLRPGSPVVVLAWLVFPIWASLARWLVRWLARLPILTGGGRGHQQHQQQQQQQQQHSQLSSTGITTSTSSSSSSSSSSSLSMAPAYALPILCSAASHTLLLTHLFRLHTTTTTTTNDLLTPSPAARSALALLELDHAAILLTFLYWVHAEAGPRALCAAALSSLLLGPGAGVCLGWLSRDHVRARLVEEEEGRRRGGGGVVGVGGSDNGGAAAVVGSRPRRRATTGHFFDGPLA